MLPYRRNGVAGGTLTFRSSSVQRLAQWWAWRGCRSRSAYPARRSRACRAAVETSVRNARTRRAGKKIIMIPSFGNGERAKSLDARSSWSARVRRRPGGVQRPGSDRDDGLLQNERVRVKEEPSVVAPAEGPFQIAWAVVTAVNLTSVDPSRCRRRERGAAAALRQDSANLASRRRRVSPCTAAPSSARSFLSWTHLLLSERLGSQVLAVNLHSGSMRSRVSILAETYSLCKGLCTARRSLGSSRGRTNGCACRTRSPAGSACLEE